MSPRGARMRWALVAAALGALSCAAAHEPQRPGLVVLLVVDQFRADLLTRYEPAWRFGFRRLLDEGYRYRDAVHDHAITSSSQGHATLATGRVPAHHGIVDNSWVAWGRGGWHIVAAGVDSTAPVPGYPGLTGVSPRDRLSDGLGDWILAADTAARAVVVAQGTASAMGLAPKNARAEVYWSSPTAGGFVTSSYFHAAAPDWVTRFNRGVGARIAADTIWKSTAPASARALARRDAATYEGDHVHTTFPHRFRDEAAEPGDPRALYAWVRGRPMHDAIILSLVREAIDALELGRRGTVDYLGVNVSSLDDVGHDYGPWSQEQLDALLRLDREIGALLDVLDARLGRRGYVIAVTGDHGVATTPEYARERGESGRRVRQAEVDSLFTAIARLGPPPRDYDPVLARRVARRAERFDFVADAMTRDELEGATPSDSFVALFQNSYRPNRVPWFPLVASDGATLAAYGVMVRLGEGAIPDFATAVHGSPYDYDRRVPLIFFGGRVGAGEAPERVRTVDVAPTLASLAGIRIPADVDGRVLAVGRAAGSSR